MQAPTKSSCPMTIMGRRMYRPVFRDHSASESAPHMGPKKEPMFWHTIIILRARCLCWSPTIAMTWKGIRYVCIRPQLIPCGHQYSGRKKSHHFGNNSVPSAASPAAHHVAGTRSARSSATSSSAATSAIEATRLRLLVRRQDRGRGARRWRPCTPPSMQKCDSPDSARGGSGSG